MPLTLTNARDPNAAPRRGGRPPGSKTASPNAKRLRKAKEMLFKDVEDMLTDDEKLYYDQAYSGQIELDPALELQLFIRLFGLYVTKMMAEGISDERFFRDFGTILAQYRGSIKDLEDIRVKRTEMKRKYKDDESNAGGVSDLTRQSASDRFESLLGSSSKK